MDPSDAQQHRFAGARRAEGFDEPPTPPAPAPDVGPLPAAQLPAAAPPPQGWDRFTSSPSPQAGPSVGWDAPVALKEAPATWGARRRVVKVASFGMASAKPSEQERAHRAAEQAIRAASWPRAVRIAVANPKGGVGKTPAALILAGIAARLRGGGVAVWDAGDSAGSLALRAEGAGSACVADIAAHPEAYSTPGTVSAAVARQSSFAAVIGSRRPREFAGREVYQVMTALDQSFAISVADTGNVPHSEAWKYAIGYSDALLIPTAPTRDSVDKALDVLARLRSGPLAHLAERATIVINRGLGGDPTLDVRGLFEARGVGAVLDVPFDKSIAANTLVRPADLSHDSQVAWTQVTAAVLSSIVVTTEKSETP